MLVGCGEWGFRDLPRAEHFRIAQRFGFHYLEFGIGGGRLGRLSEQPTHDEIDELRQLRRRFGIETPFCCIENDFTLADPAAHAAMLHKALEQMRAAQHCGATHVRLFAGFTPLTAMTEPLWQQTLAAFDVCQDLAGSLGLRIAIETHGAIADAADGSAIHMHTATTDRAALARLVKELPEPVGFNYDPANVKAAAPEDRRLCLDVINERINYCHLKDWRRRGTGWEACAIGDDDLDYRALLEEMQFDGVFLIEYEPTHDTEAGIRRSLAYLERIAPGFKFSQGVSWRR